MTRRIVVAALLLLGLAALLWRTTLASNAAVLDDKHIVLIIVDTLGAGRLSTYSSDGAPSPVINKLAQEGVLFANAYSAAPWTKPSVSTILTGKMPFAHGVTGLNSKLADAAQTVAEIMQARGRATGAIVSHVQLDTKYGFSQGFDTFVNVNKYAPHRAVVAKDVSDHAIKWLADKGDQPFFLMLHYFDPHYNYIHHEDFDLSSGYDGPITSGMSIRTLRKISGQFTQNDIEHMRKLYLEEISYTDHHIGRVLESLNRPGLRNNTLVIFAADHGEELMERGFIGHTRSLYSELTHIPLIFWLPGVFNPARVETPVSQADILPTLLTLFKDSPMDAGLHGASLAQTLRTGVEPAGRSILSEVTFQSSSHVKDAHKTSVVQWPHKLIHDRPTDTWELYDLQDDPRELHDLWPERAKDFALMADKIRDYEKQTTSSALNEGVELNKEEVKQLESLGYM
jgi:arylsulfatase A-like enzyme